jgi:hypothetical protein
LDDLRRRRAVRQEDTAGAKLGQIRSQIEGIHTGAFAGFYQNPIIGAILLPLGGGGGLAALQTLLDYLAKL